MTMATVEAESTASARRVAWTSGLSRRVLFRLLRELEADYALLLSQSLAWAPE